VRTAGSADGTSRSPAWGPASLVRVQLAWGGMAPALARRTGAIRHRDGRAAYDRWTRQLLERFGGTTSPRTLFGEQPRRADFRAAKRVSFLGGGMNFFLGLAGWGGLVTAQLAPACWMLGCGIRQALPVFSGIYGFEVLGFSIRGKPRSRRSQLTPAVPALRFRGDGCPGLDRAVVSSMRSWVWKAAAHGRQAALRRMSWLRVLATRKALRPMALNRAIQSTAR